MTPRARTITVIGLGLLVAVSTVLQATQTEQGGGPWRPYVLIGALLSAAIAVWQLIAGVQLAREPQPLPQQEPGTAAKPRRPWVLALTASLALVIALTSVLLQLRPGGRGEASNLANATSPPTPTITPTASVAQSASPVSSPTGTDTNTNTKPTPSNTSRNNPRVAPPTMVWKAAGSPALYWSTYDSGSWSGPRRFSDRRTNAGAALAVANGTVHMAWREPTDSHIFWSTYNGSAWTAPKVLDDRRTDTVPALAAVGNRVVMTWKGVDGDTAIYWSAYESGTWSIQDSVPGRSTSLSPSLATVSNRVYMTWLEAGDVIYWSALNGSSWSAKQAMLDRWTSTGPALGCTPAGNLIVAWKGGGNDTRMWWASFDGSAWSGQAAFQPSRDTSSMPGLSCNGNAMTMVWRDANTNQVAWSRYEAGAWSSPRTLPDRDTDATPAVA